MKTVTFATRFRAALDDVPLNTVLMMGGNLFLKRDKNRLFNLTTNESLNVTDYRHYTFEVLRVDRSASLNTKRTGK